MRNRHVDDAPIPAVSPLESWLAGQFGFEPAGAQTVAAAARFAYPPTNGLHPDPHPDPRLNAGQTLTVTPVYLHAGLDHLVLQSGADLAISESHAAQLVEAANAFLAQDAISLSTLAPACWLLTLPERLDLQLHSSIQAGGRNIHAYMPAGPDGRRLRQILNELQMLWHDHPVNEQRQIAGLPPVNSIWVEGETPAAKEPPASSPRYNSIWSDQPVTLGLAGALAGSDDMPVGTGPPDPARLISEAGQHAAGERSLLELSGPERLEQLDELVRLWPHRLTICLTDARQWIELLSSPRDKWCFWRRDPLVAAAIDEPAPKNSGADSR